MDLWRNARLIIYLSKKYAGNITCRTAATRICRLKRQSFGEDVCRAEGTFSPTKFNACYDRANDGTRYKLTRFLWASVFPFFKKKEEEEDQIVSLMKHATLAEQKDNLGRANFLYHEALKELNRRLTEKEIEAEEYKLVYAQITSMLANVDMRLSHWDDAEKLFKASMKACLEAGISQDSNAIVEMSLKLAQIYHNQGKEDLAVHGVEFCIATMEKKVMEESESDEDTLVLWGLVLNCYGQLLIGLRRYSEALETYSKSLDVARSVLGEVHPHVGVLLNDMSAICTAQGNYDLAEEYLRVAIKNGEYSSSEHLAAFYCNVGELKLKQKDATLAVKYCRHARDLASKSKQRVAVDAAQACLKDAAKLLESGDASASNS